MPIRTNPSLIEKIDNLFQHTEIAEALLECLKATEKHERKASVTVTYKCGWNEDHTAIDLSVAVKSKRPVRVDRNEEYLGEDVFVCSFRDDDARQQKLGDG